MKENQTPGVLPNSPQDTTSELPVTNPGKVRVYVSEKPGVGGGWVATLGAIATLLAATGLIAGGVWLGIQLILNPNSVAFVNRLLPVANRIPVTGEPPPQTLAQIKAEISQEELIPGEPLFLNSQTANADMLLPVKALRPACQTNCEQIVELRLYQPAEVEKSYQLASRVAIVGPEESFVLVPLNDEDSDNSGFSDELPITKLSRLDNKATGIWLNLSGEQAFGEASVVYGQLVHYNPSSHHLSVMLPWTSPTGQAPYWQEVTGGGMPELTIDQTVGLEPLFRVYQIKPRDFLPDPIDLEEISLEKYALNSKAYRNALLLAQNGLWSTAWELLQSLDKKKLPTSAQAQINLIRLHAQFTQSHSKKTWASPSQEVLADLINGRWDEALAVFQESVAQSRYEIVTLLKADSGRLWQRIEAALKVNPDQIEVKAWGALIIGAKQGRKNAIAWLEEQPENNPETKAQIESLLDQLDAAIADANSTNNHFSQIIGKALPLTQANSADWLQPEDNPGRTSPLELEGQQVWYQVQVAAFNDGKRWRYAPFSDIKRRVVEPGKQLWRLLGLNTDPQIQITVWKPDGQQQNTMATVKAVQITGGSLQLLAAGEVIQDAASAADSGDRLRPLAYTQTALRLLEPNTITLADLSQSQPQSVAAILPTLWRELQNAGQVTSRRVPSVPIILQKIGQLSVETIDLTDNNQPETVVTLEKPLIGTSKSFKPRTVIFSDTGNLLYSELTKDAKQSLAAIADLGDGGRATLVVNSPSNYSLKRWSAQRQRFE
ncbi:MAG: hypothetical protein KME08_09690 [Aphanothece sp. CMT-3BRIN-NPC111]|jgi:hypothetical protein|nr:hypothetical protein [Aphanothece sp. CMT-3BRIN-NPC111]